MLHFWELSCRCYALQLHSKLLLKAASVKVRRLELGARLLLHRHLALLVYASSHLMGGGSKSLGFQRRRLHIDSSLGLAHGLYDLQRLSQLGLPGSLGSAQVG